MLANFFSNTIEEPFFALVFLGLTFLFFAAGFAISRQKIWLVPLLPLFLLGVGLILADRWYVSPKEKVQAAIDACVEAVKTNRKDEILEYFAPDLAAEVKPKLNWAFSLAEFQHAYAKDVKLEVNEFTSPPTIQATFFAGVRFKVRTGTAPRDRYVCVMSLTFEEFEDGEWLVTAHEEKSAMPGSAP